MRLPRETIHATILIVALALLVSAAIVVFWGDIWATLDRYVWISESGV